MTVSLADLRLEAVWVEASLAEPGGHFVLCGRQAQQQMLGGQRQRPGILGQPPGNGRKRGFHLTGKRGGRQRLFTAAFGGRILDSWALEPALERLERGPATADLRHADSVRFEHRGRPALGLGQESQQQGRGFQFAKLPTT